jgi:hypothetical protein
MVSELSILILKLVIAHNTNPKHKTFEDLPERIIMKGNKKYKNISTVSDQVPPFNPTLNIDGKNP